LFDATCEALVVAVTAGDIRLYGLPHTRYDLGPIAEESVSPGILRLIEDNANEVPERNSEKDLETAALSRIA
jgi:hypothetical protein